MTSNKAWQRHGCYSVGTDALYDLQLLKASLGCKDNWNSMDHFDPTADSRRLFKQFFDLRTRYPVLNDGFALTQHWNLTYEDFLPFSNGSVTERGAWSVSRSGITNQTFTFNDTVWFVYTNVNTTSTLGGDCTTNSGIAGPYQADTVVRNLLYPFDNYTLGASNKSFFFNDKAPYFGCIGSINMQPYDFKVFVPADKWIAPIPALTRFSPGHDARIEVSDGSSNPNSIDVQIEFSDLMDCASVSQSMNFTLASSGKGSAPSVKPGSVVCLTMPSSNIPPVSVRGATASAWYWKATIDNVADGVLTITINNPQSQSGTGTGVSRLSVTNFPRSVLISYGAYAIRPSTISSFERAGGTTLWFSQTPITTVVRSRRAVITSFSPIMRSEPRS